MTAVISKETSYTAARILVDHLYAQSFPPIPGVDIGTAYVLAEDNLRVGGDLIDIYQFNNGSIAISVADISGKGAKAAARAALVKYGLRAYVSSGLTPAQVLRNLNLLYIETSTFDTSDSESFVSVFLGIIDPELKIMTYASAGHDPVILLNPGRLPESLPPTAPIVGIFEESQKLFHQRLVTLEPGGATLIVTTDGVTEARAPDGHFLPREDLIAFVESHSDRPAQEQADVLLRATRDFCDGRPQDDIAIVVARFP
jgi:sigma-B regulation protein RsbU (phosphoserine phosphatase)